MIRGGIDMQDTALKMSLKDTGTFTSGLQIRDKTSLFLLYNNHILSDKQHIKRPHINLILSSKNARERDFSNEKLSF